MFTWRQTLYDGTASNGEKYISRSRLRWVRIPTERLNQEGLAEPLIRLLLTWFDDFYEGA